MIKKTLLLPDIHIPYQDDRALNLVWQVMEDIRPCRVIVMGDLVDLGPISRFGQEPTKEVNVQVQLAIAREFLAELRKRAGKAPIILLEGNHEERLNKYLINHAPKLAFLQGNSGVKLLSIRNLLGLDDLSIEYKTEVVLGDYLVEHADRCAKESAATARLMVEARGESVVHGHSHRAGVYLKTTRNRTFEGIELGTLADSNGAGLDYARYPNWQLGFGIHYLDEASGHNQVDLHLIKAYRCIVGGKLYST